MENNDRANLGFEEKLFKAADKIRKNMDASEYKHIVLGLIVLKFVSDAFQQRRNALEKEIRDPSSGFSDNEDAIQRTLEDRDEYAGESIFWAPAESSSRYVFMPDAPLLLNHVAAQEDLAGGERVREFTVKIQPEHGREAITIYAGRNIGHRAVCRFPEVRAYRAWLEITRSDGEPKMRCVAFYAA